VLGVADDPLVAGEVKALAVGADLRLRRTRTACREVAREMDERLVHTDDVITYWAAWWLHGTPLSLGISHSLASIEHGSMSSIRSEPQPTCD